MNPSDNWNDQLDEHEFDNEGNFDDDTAETLPCPECGAEIYEESEQCPACGAYITFNNSIWLGKPVWWIILGLLGIVATVLWLLSV